MSSAFRRAVAKTTKLPGHVVELPPNAFADTPHVFTDKSGASMGEKPSTPVRVGLRLVPEQAFHHARAAAAQEAWRVHPEEGDIDNRTDCFNQRLVGLIVAHAAVDPSDATKPFFGAMAEDKVFLVLTSDGIRALYNEFEAFAMSASPTSPEATDQDLDILADGLMSGELLASMDLDTARRARRLLRHVLDLARPVEVVKG